MVDPRIDELKQLLPRCMLPDWVRLGSRAVRLFRDQHHPDKHDALLNRLLQQVRASVELREHRARSVPTVSYPSDLPISARKDEIVAAIRTNQVVVLAGETGSGKTTQIPKMCLEAGLGVEATIGCTQPRRVAALSISRRIAEELNVQWGRDVGCKIRFDDRSSSHTYIKLMTDGILLAETQGDPTLAEYNAIILDEAHERSLNIDFLLGYLKTLLARRSDLKLIVTSATIDTEAFSRHFDNAPIIEVSGRVYPVDVVYQPLDSAAEERGEVSYVDAAAQTAEKVVYESNSGDILVFMPTERDIRETSDQIETRLGSDAEIVPLFGRLSSGDQQRVFTASPRRKIVVATNIAETSLTIPGIRYVIDSGLARIGRYNPRTRTKRLPIEPISQSSANQRKGRPGRVQEGLCIRLYSEEDFAARPPFTQPEIQRANLAEVILRMKVFHLGEIETFPFVQPPTPAAIASGYSLLQELGALDEKREVTPLGRDLARLPIDPALGRMLLQSQREHAPRELLIIAAGLSIQDPRERPMDQKDAAMAAHRRFNDPSSDFLTLLNIWNQVHDEWEKLRGQNQRRKFCKQHFLSYIRMREWQDLYAQLHDALEELGTVKLNESNAAYPAIHRSILAGLLGHVAHREERNQYKGAGNRALTLFPGSSLFERGDPPRKPGSRDKKAQAPKPKSNQPQWIVAGEIVETSQLFARTVAGIEPQWIVDLAPHLCKVAHVHPHWSPHAGRVLAEEITTFHGLDVQRRKVFYGNVNPKDATAIFIRSALVEDQLFPVRDDESGQRHQQTSHQLPAFLEHNRKIREKIENWQTRVRRYDLGDLDERLAQFYGRRIENVASRDELNRLVRENPDPDFLRITEQELAGGHALDYDAAAFPDYVPVAGQPVVVSYAYAPGEEHDGVTIQLPFTIAQSVSAGALEWAVPGLREEKISELLRALPKSFRRELMPFPPKVAEIAGEFKPSGPSFLHDLGRFLHQRYGVDVPASAWPSDALPAHLRPRIEITGAGDKKLAGRDLAELRKHLQQTKSEPPREPQAWQRTAERWERFGLTTWSLGDLPERITVSEGPGLPQYAWPGLKLEENGVNLRLFPTAELARANSLGGVQKLVELSIQKDLGWIEKDLRALKQFEPFYAPLGSLEELQDSALQHLKRYLLPREPLPALTEANFRAAVEQARARLPGIAQQLMDRVGGVLNLRQQVARKLGLTASAKATVSQGKPATFTSFAQLAQPAAAPTRATHPLTVELNALVPPRFLDRVEYESLVHIPRYLKALLTRVERAALNPAKDQEKARQTTPYAEALQQLESRQDLSPAKFALIQEFRWMLNEFKVSTFAQELGTAIPVSPKRLDQQLERIRLSA